MAFWHPFQNNEELILDKVWFITNYSEKIEYVWEKSALDSKQRIQRELVYFQKMSWPKDCKVFTMFHYV